MMSSPTDPQSQNEQKAEQESREKPAGQPGGFENDPKDPSNPNEVRERYLEKIDKIKE
jgi:hypothetical protein